MYVIFNKTQGKNHSIKSWAGLLILLFMALVFYYMYTDKNAIDAKNYLLHHEDIIRKYGADPSVVLSQARHISASIDLDGIKHEGYSRYIFTIIGNRHHDTVSVFFYSDNKKEFNIEARKKNTDI